ncbi:UNVERIFIED_CONTAM: hypothetical protein Scaly_0670000 [Sesamum calycinum]|uniref:Beta-Casp domain-containing protein n=1 Tax=Sesamum calycinum TaxID=2727403 RepID=A0AAW2R6L0_9LAMI
MSKQPATILLELELELELDSCQSSPSSSTLSTTGARASISELELELELNANLAFLCSSSQLHTCSQRSLSASSSLASYHTEDGVSLVQEIGVTSKLTESRYRVLVLKPEDLLAEGIGCFPLAGSPWKEFLQGVLSLLSSMEFTCLSEGKGYYFPPCHILDKCGFRVLFDCPMDLSSLAIFSPVPTGSNSIAYNEKFSCSSEKYAGLELNEDKRRKIDKPLDANSLIGAEPHYRTVKNLLLWNVSFIDVVLISTPMVYATEATARIGQLMMEDLVSMHKEYRQFYGAEESDAPQWMKWDELELLPLELRQIVSGADGTDFGGWMPLYSAADVKACMLKVECLKYAEEACYAAAMSFNYKALQRSDVILYSDFSSCNGPDKFDNEDNCSGAAGNSYSNLSSDDVNSEGHDTLLNDDEYLEEMEKLNFICSCSVDCIKAGGSVLIPISRIGITLQLLERFALDLASENMRVPIFLISSVAEELIAFTNIIPEWLCEQWQDRGAKISSLLKILQPRHILFPEILRQHIGPLETLFSFNYYSEDKTVHIPYMKEDSELDIAVELACQLQYTTLKQQDMNISRLKGELMIEHGRYRLHLGNDEQVSSQPRPLVHFGRIDLNNLLTALQKLGMNTTLEEVTGAAGSHEASRIRVSEPSKAMIEVMEAQTVISAADENIASVISQVISGVLDCI